MRLKNLGLTEDCRNVIKKYAKFFGNKKRETEFKNFDIDEKNTDNIDLIITAILLNIKSINEDEILKEIVKYYFEDEKKYEELFKFGNEDFILGLFNDTFGVSVNSYEELQEPLDDCRRDNPSRCAIQKPSNPHQPILYGLSIRHHPPS
jgi:hypothetical protein